MRPAVCDRPQGPGRKRRPGYTIRPLGCVLQHTLGKIFYRRRSVERNSKPGNPLWKPGVSVNPVGGPQRARGNFGSCDGAWFEIIDACGAGGVDPETGCAWIEDDLRVRWR